MALIDVVKYSADSDHEFAWKFPSEDLKLGTQLIVNEGQQAIFVKGGQALDVFMPGTHTLSTGNIPILNKLINLPFGGNTPFTAEVWYINTTVKRDLPWGTPSPIPFLDKEIGFPVSVRAFGRWGARVIEPMPFLTQILGTQVEATASKIQDYFIGRLIQVFSQSVISTLNNGEANILNITTKLEDISLGTIGVAQEEFKKFGIELISFDVESINIPDEELKKIQAVFEKTLEAKELSKVELGGAYAAIKSFEVMNTAAGNEGDNTMGSLVGAGIGLGAGLPIGQQIGQSIDIKGNATSEASSSNQKSVADRLKELKSLRDEDLITEEDFIKKRDEIISSI
jgi:membrane protease subunit (stomatin/prohibitin family)